MSISAPPRGVLTCVYCGYRRFTVLRDGGRLILKCVDCKRVQPSA